MESLRAAEKINFGVLHARLITLVKRRIYNGEYTERGLARVLDVSQSQLHNVLKGARKLQNELADRIMDRLGITAIQLLKVEELKAALAMCNEAPAWPRMATAAESAGSDETEQPGWIKKPHAVASHQLRLKAR